jgi:hypothetical protein
MLNLLSHFVNSDVVFASICVNEDEKNNASAGIGSVKKRKECAIHHLGSVAFVV